MRQGGQAEANGRAQERKAPHGCARGPGVQGTAGHGLQGEQYGVRPGNSPRDEEQGHQAGSVGEQTCALEDWVVLLFREEVALTRPGLVRHPCTHVAYAQTLRWKRLPHALPICQMPAMRLICSHTTVTTVQKKNTPQNDGENFSSVLTTPPLFILLDVPARPLHQTHLMVLSLCGGSPGGKDELDPGNGSTGAHLAALAKAADAHAAAAAADGRVGGASAQEHTFAAAEAALQVIFDGSNRRRGGARRVLQLYCCP